MAPADMLKLLNTYFFWACLFVFPAYVLLRLVAARIYAAARHPKSFVSLDRADHLLTRPEDAEYAAEVIAAWAGRYLGVAPDAQRAQLANGAKA